MRALILYQNQRLFLVRATGLVLAPAVSSFAERERLKVARSGSALTAHRAVIHYRPVKSCYAIVLNKDGRRKGIRPYMVAGEGLHHSSSGTPPA